MIASKIQNLAAAPAEFRILDLSIEEVLVVRNLDFADWPVPESAAAKSTNQKYDFAGWALS